MTKTDATKDSDHIQGRMAGEKWAATMAIPEELERLEALRIRDELELFDNGTSGYGPAELFAFEARPETFKDRKAAEDFWDEALGGEHDFETANRMSFLRGFLDGACGV